MKPTHAPNWQAFFGWLLVMGFLPTAIFAGAWEDAQSMAGGRVPDVPMPGAPKIERSGRTESGDAQAWEREQARQERVLEQARQREERRRQRQERQEAERRRRLEERWYGRTPPTPRRPRPHRHEPTDRTTSQPPWPQGLPPKRPQTPPTVPTA